MEPETRLQPSSLTPSTASEPAVRGGETHPQGDPYQTAKPRWGERLHPPPWLEGRGLDFTAKASHLLLASSALVVLHFIQKVLSFVRSNLSVSLMASAFYVLIRKPSSHQDGNNILLFCLGKQSELIHNKWLGLASIKYFCGY